MRKVRTGIGWNKIAVVIGRTYTQMTQKSADVSERDEQSYAVIGAAVSEFRALNTSVSSSPRTICGHL